jgi:serine/threonine protein kinase
MKAALKNEIDILQKLHSDNVVGFYDVMESSKNYYIIQELCDGDLSSEIKVGLNRPENEAVDMLRQICNGFLTLVREGIIHRYALPYPRDLKPANIMKKAKLLKLGDFGFAKQMENTSMVSTCVGTPLYMSLEILKGETYTSKCDIWALGFIFYEILHGNTPWTANTEVQLVRNIEKLPLNIKRQDLSAETQDFLRKCLQLKECDRISWDQIFMHPIFQGYFANKANEFK